MMRATILMLAALVAVAVVPLPAPAQTVEFKLLPRYSVATFKSDAPLETFLGHSSDVAGGIQGSLSVDPARPQGGKATVRVDMTLVRTGIEKRDADMRGKPYLETDVEANRWVTFQVTKVEVAGPLEPGQTVPAKIHGLLTVKNKPVEKVADATLTYIKLTPEQVEAQKRFGFTSDNIKVRAKTTTTFTDHGMQVPQILIFKVANEIQIETDLVFVK